MSAYKLECGHVGFVTGEMGIGDSLMCPIEWELSRITEDISQPTVTQVTAVIGPDGRDTGETTYTQVPAAPNGQAPERAYGCSWGCGNPYDYVIINVGDATTEFLCLVCLLKLCQEMINAVVNPDDPDVKAAMAEYAALDRAPMTSGRVRKRGKNAPADIDDDDLIEAFDSIITTDELPDDMKPDK